MQLAPAAPARSEWHAPRVLDTPRAALPSAAARAGVSGADPQAAEDAVGTGVARHVLQSLRAARRTLEDAIEGAIDEVHVRVGEAVSGGVDAAHTEAVPIWVVARLRPEQPPLGTRSARLQTAHGCVTVRGAVRAAQPTRFQMDALLEEGASQLHSYGLGPAKLLPRLLRGQRCAMLYLGANGAGKTHSAFGDLEGARPSLPATITLAATTRPPRHDPSSPRPPRALPAPSRRPGVW